MGEPNKSGGGSRVTKMHTATIIAVVTRVYWLNKHTNTVIGVSGANSAVIITGGDGGGLIMSMLLSQVSLIVQKYG